MIHPLDYLAHCSYAMLSALATWQIESKMCSHFSSSLVCPRKSGLDFPLFCSTFLLANNKKKKKKQKQNQCKVVLPVLLAVFSSNDQPLSSLGKCSSSLSCRLSYFAISRKHDFLTAPQKVKCRLAICKHLSSQVGTQTYIYICRLS